MEATFGPGITNVFMRPYNTKVWAYAPSRLDFAWIGERVAVPDLRKVLKSLCTGEDQVSWGPNALFRFPLRGGTGAVWASLGRRLPPRRVTLGARVTRIDAQRRTAICEDGRSWKYRVLINSMPLDALIRVAEGVVRPEAADALLFSSTHIVGVGVEGPTPEHLRTKCWMYFPERNSPYYRVTVFSNYSFNNVARPREQWSLMSETSESPDKPVDQRTVVADTLRALREDQLLPAGCELVTTVHRRIPQGYPTPFLGRDRVVGPTLRAFEDAGIFSRGRFGAWMYEVSNQDHSFAQGYECVDRQLQGGGPELEPTLHAPNLVNSRRNP